MNRTTSFIFGVLLAIGLTFGGLWSAPRVSPEAKVLENMVIQDQGRIKPLDTFARYQLLSVFQKSSIDGDAAITWLTGLWFQPEAHQASREFKIREPEVLEALGVEPRLDHRYSFVELREGMGTISEDLHQWFQKEKEERSLVEDKIVRLYSVMMNYYQLSKAWSLFVKDISIDHEALASQFKLEVGERASYFHFQKQSALLREKVSNLNDDGEERDDEDMALLKLVAALSVKLQDEMPAQMAIIPSPPEVDVETWSSPWRLMGQNEHDPWTLTRLVELEEIADAIALGDVSRAESVSQRFKEGIAHRGYADLEVLKNRADLFYRSMYCYMAALMLLLISWMVWTKALWRTSFAILCVGMVIHGVGIVLRMLIMGRPPVSTLYESIIFVGFVAVFLCFILEWVRRNGIGIFSATVLGIILHFIGFSYSSDGDTMGMLVAVLDSNFWLATHVVTITMGYGVTVVAGIVGHLYLGLAIFRPHAQKTLQELYKNAVGLSLVALLFTTLGTILGGIWADQSWGRFWGWDPKENGAMLIVLWLLMLLHGRISGLVKPLGFSAGLVLGNIVVALAWFGVNLLAVGLHNYGFTDSIARNLAIFCGIETILAAVGYFGAVAVQRRTLTKP